MKAIINDFKQDFEGVSKKHIVLGTIVCTLGLPVVYVAYCLLWVVVK